MPATKKKPTRAAGQRESGSETWTDEERAAMQEHARDMKKRRAGATDGTADVLAAIAKMPEPDRGLARRIHEIVTTSAPDLAPRTWYGMPAYARDGKVVCFFQAAAKFKARYASFGFNDVATLDDGTLWPTAWAVTKLTKADEKAIAALVRKAVGGAG